MSPSERYWNNADRQLLQSPSRVQDLRMSQDIPDRCHTDMSKMSQSQAHACRGSSDEGWTFFGRGQVPSQPGESRVPILGGFFTFLQHPSQKHPKPQKLDR